MPESAITDEGIDRMLEQSKQIAEGRGIELTEEGIRDGIRKTNPCGRSVLGQCWGMESSEFQAATSFEEYASMMTERIIGRFQVMTQNQSAN